jgi:hypothetical protein
VSPFYLPQDVIFDATLLGYWKGVESLENGSLTVKARTADSYVIELTQNDKEKKTETSWTFEGHLFKFEQKTYLDLVPTALRVRGKKQRFQTSADDLGFLVPVHTAMQLDHDSENLSLSWTAGGEMSSLFKKEDEEKKLAREKRRREILAMSTEELQRRVLGSPPAGDTAFEMGMHFIRQN